MKSVVFILSILVSTAVVAQKSTKQEKKEAKKEKINQLIRQEEEGALIYNKQNAFGIKLNTDGYGIFLEKGKLKTPINTNIFWLELGERKHPKEEKLSKGSSIFPGLAIGNPFVYGKVNNVFYGKLGFGKQILFGGKGNKNGVAVAFIYGGGLSVGMLKPYYLEVNDAQGRRDIRYKGNETEFLDESIIIGSSGIFKGFNEIEYIPGFHTRTAIRFDYGRYNELLSAIEVGINTEYYTKEMQQMIDNKNKHFFYHAYVALTFGRRK